MEFSADKIQNPYTVENMKNARDIMKEQSLSCNTDIFKVRVTHKYIRFKPSLYEHLDALQDDTTLILFDYPLHKRLTRAGTYYKDPVLSEDEFNYQYTVVAIDRGLPSGVPYEVLDELYLPEEDPNLTQYYDTDLDDCITKLIETALIITGNLDTIEDTTTVTPDGEVFNKKRPKKYTPAGNIKMWDDSHNGAVPLRGVKVRAHRWFEIRETLTDNNGNFNIGHQFRYDVNYSIKWERNDFEIRHKKIGQAYYNGPKQRSNWNLQINANFSRIYAIIHRAALRYYYENRAGLKSPPTKSQMLGRMTIGAFDWEQTGNGECRMWARWLSGPEIRIYKDSRVCEAIYSTTIHELAHASHWNLGTHSEYINATDKVCDSWARGVQWVITRFEYPNHKGGSSSNQYTQVVVDMIDNLSSQQTNNGLQTDSVTGYTLKEIEDALKGQTGWNEWRDNIKNKYNNATETNLDQLFDYWWNY